MSNIDKFTQGVIYPIPAAFQDVDALAIDYDAIMGYVKHLHEHGAKIILTTAGTSRFNLLSEVELCMLNWSAVEAFEGVSIMGLRPMADIHLHREIRTVNESAVKPDALLLFYPDRYYDDESIVGYFHRAAEKSHCPVMAHGMFMRHALGGMYNYTPELVSKIKEHPNIIGIKEESSVLGLAFQISRLADKDFLVFPAGGSCRRFLLTAPAGAQTFLGGIGNIFPEIEETFFKEYSDGNIVYASHIVMDYEAPLFDVFGKIGWHKALQEALNYKKLLVTVNRRPFSEITEEQKTMVRNVVDDIEHRWYSNAR